MSESVVFVIALIAVLGVAAQWLAWRLRLPSILLLLAFGFVAGPVAGWVDPDAVLGDLLFPLVSISVALILYEGGLTLRFAELPKVGGVVRNLVTIGAAVTWVLSAGVAYLVFDLDLKLSALLGAVLVVTGPTVIGPMIRHIRPTGAVGPILKWEGIIIDPIGALLAVLVFEAIQIGEVREASAHAAISIGRTILIGGGLGAASGALLAIVIHRFWAPDFLQNAVSLMLVIAVFTVANAFQHESGLLAVTVMGIVLANQKFADVRHIVEFKENLRVLLISALFILLAARLELAELKAIAAGGAVLVLVLALIVRPIGVFLSTLTANMKRSERIFLAWMAPRGIVAAAISSVFSLRLEEAGYAQARMLTPITFIVIIGTVALYGLTAPVAARRLGVAVANPQGVLFVGAQAWVRALATALKQKGFDVLLVDSNRETTATARMEGHRTHTGSALSEHLLDEIDLGGVGHVMAVTPNDWINMLTVQRFRPIIGSANCYQLSPRQRGGARRQVEKHLQGRSLFAEDVGGAELEREIAGGAVIKATRLSDEFNYKAFRVRYGETARPLIIIKENDRLEIMTADRGRDPVAGETLICLVHEPKDSAAPPETSEHASVRE